MATTKPSFASMWTQFFPPKPEFTENDIPSDLSGKVYLVTGATSGMGKELARLLYSRNANVYAACRDKEKTLAAISEMKKTAPTSTGELVLLPLGLADLAKVKNCAEEFLSRETKLHVLFNNAGVMTGPATPAPKTAQGYELALGVNCVGTFLLTKLLMQYAPEDFGIDMDNLDYHVPKPGIDRYGISKCGDWLLGVEFGRRYKADGIVSVPVNPGNVLTELARNAAWWLKVVGRLVASRVSFGVSTQLFSAFSPNIKIDKVDWTKDWVIPWGRLAPLRADLPKAVIPEEEGGNGNARLFWEWNEEQVKYYL
ncbi:NAD(P)-binding protein [Rhypophila decipiens]|uniref:NAD(P)-binding protein n=1 Tax=Rhypophila decipiens TaxID=261697 RepID=A0AAN7B3U5_9PEZI|nr:NAD(P)-binding protein [Rhypophila decipiens]